MVNAYLSGSGCSNGYLGRRSYGQWGYGGHEVPRGVSFCGRWAALRSPRRAPAAPPEVDARVVARNDAALERLLRAQITDPVEPAAGRRAGRVRDVPRGVGRRPDRDRGGVVDRTAIEASRRAGSAGADSPGGAVSGAFAERRGQYRSALHQFQFAARYRIRGPQRGHRGGHRENVWRRGNAARAAAIPGEGGGRHERGRHPHAESSLGGLLRAGAGQRRVSGCGVHAAHRAVAGGGHRYR